LSVCSKNGTKIPEKSATYPFNSKMEKAIVKDVHRRPKMGLPRRASDKPDTGRV
jgi:hypothetical protein